MPNFISDRGKWRAAQERAVNIRTGEVYEGEDREAVAAIKKANGRIGRDSSEDPEVIMRARQLNMSVEDYLKLGAPPEEVIKEKEVEREKTVNNNQEKTPPSQQAVQPQGTGKIQGGFGDQPV